MHENETNCMYKRFINTEDYNYNIGIWQNLHFNTYAEMLAKYCDNPRGNSLS